MSIRPDTMAQFFRSAEQQGKGIRIGEWTLKRGMMPGNIWIQHESGEGADVQTEKVSAVIAELFEREF